MRGTRKPPSGGASTSPAEAGDFPRATQLQNAITKISKTTRNGGSPCAGLDALKSQITSFVPRKVTTAQRDQLSASIDAIKAENPC